MKILTPDDFFPEQRLPADAALAPAFLSAALERICEFNQPNVHRYCEAGVFRPGLVRSVRPESAGRVYRLFSLADVINGMLLRTLHSVGIKAEIAQQMARDTLQPVATWLTYAERWCGKRAPDDFQSTRFLVAGEQTRTLSLKAGNNTLVEAVEAVQEGGSFLPAAGEPSIVVAIDMLRISRYVMEQLIKMKAAGTLAGLLEETEEMTLDTGNNIPVKVKRPHEKRTDRITIPPIPATVLVDRLSA